MPTTLKQIQTQKQKLAPKQVLQARLLQLNSVNLEQAVLEELEENPLLEQVDQNESQISDEILEDSPVNDIDAPLEDMYSNESNYYLSEQKQEIPIADQNTLLENLINQINYLDLNEQEHDIAEEILWNTNERGYLDTDLVLIADRYDLLENEVEPLLYKIQRLEPKGIGSRNLKECLMIQLENDPTSYSYQIIENCFDDFMHKRYEKIKDKIKCNDQELQNAIENISNLNPRPGEGYLDKFQTVIPDVIVRLDGDDWLINTNDLGVPELRISKVYQEQLGNKNIKGDAKKFIKEKFASAQWFIEAIHQRSVTMISVMSSIIESQPEWFDGNMDYLRPLRLQDIADKINMDISTVSRSTRGKFADTPYGIFELKYFFTDSIKLDDGRIIGTFIIKRALKNIIISENKKSPYSDDELVNILRKEGYRLARRTVAKYRDQMGYSVARLRKEI